MLYRHTIHVQSYSVDQSQEPVVEPCLQRGGEGGEGCHARGDDSDPQSIDWRINSFFLVHPITPSPQKPSFLELRLPHARLKKRNYQGNYQKEELSSAIDCPRHEATSAVGGVATCARGELAATCIQAVVLVRGATAAPTTVYRESQPQLHHHHR